MKGGAYVELKSHATADRPFDMIEHIDGVTWFDAPVPRRWHKCWAQTRALVTVGGSLDRVQRCACGAISTGSWSDPYWMDRNSRKAAS